MGITIVIIGGLVAMTGVASFFSYLTEKRKRQAPESSAKLEEMERRIALLEEQLGQRDARVEQIAEDVSFVNKLIEDRMGDGQRNAETPPVNPLT